MSSCTDVKKQRRRGVAYVRSCPEVEVLFAERSTYILAPHGGSVMTLQTHTYETVAREGGQRSKAALHRQLFG